MQLLKKSRSEGTLNDKKVQVFSSLVTMKFKPQNENGAIALRGLREKHAKSKLAYPI